MPRQALILCCAALLSLPTLAQEDDLEARAQASRAAVKDFATTLKGELVAAMEAGGPLNAIAVCNLEAPKIADSVSAARDMSVGRTSLQTRNAANQPDAWERRILQQFEERKAAGEDPKTLEHYERVETGDGQPMFRYMKAIPTGEVCLKCHGSQLDPQVSAKLDELYPEDQARGFDVGDLRGAFTIRQP